MPKRVYVLYLQNEKTKVVKERLPTLPNAVVRLDAVSVEWQGERVSN